MSERQSILCMSHIRGLGSKRIASILKHLGAKGWWSCTYQDLLAIPGIGEEFARTIICKRDSLDPIKIEQSLRTQGIHFLLPSDRGYPAAFHALPESPSYVFVKGEILEQDRMAIAIVGTRKPTYYGLKAAQYLGQQAAESGIAVISGLARGIDRMAHEAALANKGRTIAVLAHGLDQIYPSEHAKLADKIMENGALLSEFPPGMPARPQHFTARNRWISGLSLCTIVVEAGAKSGALITAQFALEQGKDVLAVPGSIFDGASVGTNTLLFEGATPVRSFADVMDVIQGMQWIGQSRLEGSDRIGFMDTQEKLSEPCAPEQRKILSLLSSTGITVEELLNCMPERSLSELHLQMLQLELDGYIIRKGERIYPARI
ncbi:DNA-processing protein DprA [Fodinisporobacter ferrooxydans]|uniref:DNA-processing protein DprA n=1 Tax=Fodinisporobacter ferrooxydans TaxID=2901836 RepID=A0ABY4CJC3_9BACL|nr:DNA-processing protein DprA [Alicyclobacillaceae bacterium MYW30-H2]